MICTYIWAGVWFGYWYLKALGMLMFTSDEQDNDQLTTTLKQTLGIVCALICSCY